MTSITRLPLGLPWRTATILRPFRVLPMTSEPLGPVWMGGLVGVGSGVGSVGVGVGSGAGSVAAVVGDTEALGAA